MRDPNTADLVAYICQIQPELDANTAERLLQLDPTVRDWIALYWQQQRTISQSLLDLHLEMSSSAGSR